MPDQAPSLPPSRQRRTVITIAVILALGALAAVLILRSGTSTQTAAKASASHSESKDHAEAEHHGEQATTNHADEEAHSDTEHHDGKTTNSPAADAKEAQHDDDGLVNMDAARARAAGVALAEAGATSIRAELQLPGEIRFDEDRTAHVVPRVAGVAETVPARLGQAVRKGDVLAVLSSAAISEQRSEQQAAQKRLALARTTYAREKQLWEEKISAEQDYLQARQALQEAEIAAANAGQKLAAVGAGSGNGALNRFELRAPFDGVVVEKHLSAGEAVREDTAVFTISDLRSVWAEMRVAASDLPAVRVGAAATVRATAFNSSATAKVAYVGSLIGEQTRTAPARVTLPNPEGVWRPGLFVNVTLTASQQTVPVSVATRSIQRLNEKASVVFIPVDGGFKAQTVRLGRTDTENTEVLEGLQAGQRYVREGSFMLKSELGKASAEHAH